MIFKSPLSQSIAIVPIRTPNSWSKKFLEAGEKRLAGDTTRQATSNEVKTLRAEARDLKEALAEQMLENRLLKKSMIEDGGDEE